MRDRGAARVSLYLPTTPLTQDAQAARIALNTPRSILLPMLAKQHPALKKT